MICVLALAGCTQVDPIRWRLESEPDLVQQMKAQRTRIADRSSGFSVLHSCVLRDYVDAASWLLEERLVDVNQKDDKSGMTPLHFAKSAPMVALLMKFGADPTIEDFGGSNALYYLAERGPEPYFELKRFRAFWKALEQEAQPPISSLRDLCNQSMDPLVEVDLQRELGELGVAWRSRRPSTWEGE